MDRQFDRYKAHFEQVDEISEANKEQVRWFLDECAAAGIGLARQQNYLYGFKTLLTQFAEPDFDLATATEKELKRIVGRIHRTDYSEYSKSFFKQCIKKFYKFKSGGQYPSKVRFISTTEKKKPSVKKEDLYSYEEIYRIMSQLRSIRDRAFIITLYESAARTGELLNVRLRDVTFDEHGDFIRLHGLKNMPDRDIQLVEAGYYLKEWIKSHPYGGDPFNVQDPSKPLWVKLQQFSCKYCGVSKVWHPKRGCEQYEPLVYEPMKLFNILRNFERACQHADVRKSSYRLYNLRHSRITEVSKFMSHEQVTKFAGWKPGSGQFNVYVHLSSEDVNQAIREQYNLGQEEKQEPVTCKLCWQKNPAGSTECRNCRRPLTVEATFQKDQVRNALSVLAELQEQGKLDQLMEVATKLRSHHSS